MKTVRSGFFAMSVLVCAACLWPGGSSAAVPRSRISVAAKVKTSRDSRNEETVKQSRRVEVITDKAIKSETATVFLKIRNAEKKRMDFQLNWFFVSEHTARTQQGVRSVQTEWQILSRGTKPLAMEPGSSVEETVVSDPFIYTVENVDTDNQASGERKTQIFVGGDAYIGYVILITVDGKVIVKKSNSSRFLKDAWVEQCLLALDNGPDTQESVPVLAEEDLERMKNDVEIAEVRDYDREMEDRTQARVLEVNTFQSEDDISGFRIQLAVEVADENGRLYFVEFRGDQGSGLDPEYTGEDYWELLFPYGDLRKLSVSGYCIQYGVMNGDVFVPMVEKKHNGDSLEVLKSRGAEFPGKVELWHSHRFLDEDDDEEEGDSVFEQVDPVS